MERKRVQQYVVTGSIEPREREEQPVEQIGRSHEAVDHAQGRVWAVVVDPVLSAHHVVAHKAPALLTHRRVDRLEAAVEPDIAYTALGHPLRNGIGRARRDARLCGGSGERQRGILRLGEFRVEPKAVPFGTGFGPTQRGGDHRRHHRGAQQRCNCSPQCDVGDGRGINDQPLTKRQIDAAGQPNGTGVVTRHVWNRDRRINGSGVGVPRA